MVSSGLNIRPVTVENWPELFLRFSDGSFEQSSTYAEAAARRIGGRALYLGLWSGAELVSAAALRIRSLPLIGRGIAWCPSGPLLCPDGKQSDPGPVLALLRDEVVLRQGHILRLRPPGTAFLDMETLGSMASDAGFSPAPSQRDYQSCAIDLSRDENALMRQLQGKWRTDLRFALGSGLAVESGRNAELRARFLRVFRQTQESKGFTPDITPEFHFALEGADYRHEIFMATKDGHDVAGIVVGHSGACSTYLFGAMAAAGRPFRAGYFLTWTAIRAARQSGALWYDMGGIDPVVNPDVARFKTRMNGAPIVSTAFEAVGGGPLLKVVKGMEKLRNRIRRV